MTLTVREFKNYASNKLSGFRDDAEIQVLVKFMLEDFAGLRSPGINTDQKLNSHQTQQLNLVLQRLIEGEPYQYISGKQFFAGHWFIVNQDVLIPRPETEELFFLVVQWFNDNKIQPKTVVDHCTGSGCLAVSLKKVFKEAVVIGTDISKGALAVAEMNAKILRAEVRFEEVDLLRDDYVKHLPGKVDLIISNPPYISPSEMKAMSQEVLCFEPHFALFVPESDPLIFYNHMIEYQYDILSDHGLMAFEINPLFFEDLHRLASKYYQTQILKDLSGKNRFLFAQK